MNYSNFDFFSVIIDHVKLPEFQKPDPRSMPNYLRIKYFDHQWCPDEVLSNPPTSFMFCCLYIPV